MADDCPKVKCCPPKPFDHTLNRLPPVYNAEGTFTYPCPPGLRCDRPDVRVPPGIERKDDPGTPPPPPPPDWPYHRVPNVVSEAVTVNCTHLGHPFVGNSYTLPGGCYTLDIPSTLHNAPPLQYGESVRNLQAHANALAFQLALQRFKKISVCTEGATTIGCTDYGALRPRVEYPNGRVLWLTPVFGSGSIPSTQYLRWLLSTSDVGLDWFNSFVTLRAQANAGDHCWFAAADPDYANPYIVHFLTNYHGYWQLFSVLYAENIPMGRICICTEGGGESGDCTAMGCSSDGVLLTETEIPVYCERGDLLNLVPDDAFDLHVSGWVRSCGGALGACPPDGDPPIWHEQLECVQPINFLHYVYNADVKAWGLYPMTIEVDQTLCQEFGVRDIHQCSWQQLDGYTQVRSATVREYTTGTSKQIAYVERRAKLTGDAGDPSGSYAPQPGHNIDCCGATRALFSGDGVAVVTMEVPPP